MLTHFRHAARNLRRAPGFAGMAILSLALGTGGNIAMFSLIEAAFIKPLAYHDSDRLVVVRRVVPALSQLGPSLPMKAGVVLQWRSQLRSFESIGAATGASLTLSGAGDAEKIDAVMMTAEFLDVLGAKPQLGRWFLRSEEDAGGADVVVLGNSLWSRRFSADPGVLGRTILLDGKPYEIVGIAPVSMPFPHGQLEPQLPEQAELFIPLRLSKYDLDVTSNIIEAECVTIGRLKPGIALDTARSELEVSMAALSRINRRGLEMHARLDFLRDALVSDNRKALLILSGAVVFVLLIVCVNIANLTLVRATSRRHELAVRAALGADTYHLLAGSMAESLLIALGGTVAGLVLAWWLIDMLIAIAPADLVSVHDTTLNGNVLAFATCLCVLTAIQFGFLPAWRISRTRLLGMLYDQRHGTTDGPESGRLRAALVSAELALGTVLLIAAMLLLTSLQRVMKVPRGFEVENVVAVDLSVPEAKYRTFEQKLSFFRRVQEGVAGLPGIRRTSYANGVPLAPPLENAYAILPGKPVAAWEDRPIASWWQIGGGYFAAMGIPIIAGIPFKEEEPQLVAVVSETAARRLWPGENPIGKRLQHPMDPVKGRWFQVIGVVADVREQRLEREPSAIIYLPYWQASCCRLHTGMLTLVARTSTDPKVIGSAIREQVWKVDRQVAVPELRTMSRIVSASMTKRRFQTIILTVFAVVALLLAASGVYGVSAYVVTQRRREIGVRIALGAKPRDVLGHLLREGTKPVAIGLAAGVATAAVLSRLFASMLFDVQALDPLTFATVPLLLLLTAVLACYLPARRAAVIDPMIILRQE